MGTTYTLYDHKSKEMIDLGKLRGWTDEGPTCFDMPIERIVQFLARHAEGNLSIFPDTVETPDDIEDGWVEVEDWVTATEKEVV